MAEVDRSKPDPRDVSKLIDFSLFVDISRAGTFNLLTREVGSRSDDGTEPILLNNFSSDLPQFGHVQFEHTHNGVSFTVDNGAHGLKEASIVYTVEDVGDLYEGNHLYSRRTRIRFPGTIARMPPDPHKGYPKLPFAFSVETSNKYLSDRRDGHQFFLHPVPVPNIEVFLVRSLPGGKGGYREAESSLMHDFNETDRPNLSQVVGYVLDLATFFTHKVRGAILGQSLEPENPDAVGAFLAVAQTNYEVFMAQIIWDRIHSPEA